MSADRPFRLRVLDAIGDRLKAITPENGFTSDLSENVFRGRTYYGDDEPLPMVSLLEPPQTVEPIPGQPDNRSRVGEWDILVQGWVKDDPENPTDPAYFLSADVCKALAEAKKEATGRHPDLFGMGAGFDRKNGITGMTIGSPVVRPPDEGVSARACFYLILTLKIAEDTSEPFG